MLQVFAFFLNAFAIFQGRGFRHYAFAPAASLAPRPPAGVHSTQSSGLAATPLVAPVPNALSFKQIHYQYIENPDFLQRIAIPGRALP